MRDAIKNQMFYIDGRWVESIGGQKQAVLHPATDEVVGLITLGTRADVDRATRAAKSAFEGYSRSSVKDRVELFDSIIDEWRKCTDELAHAMTTEMGAPITFSREVQLKMALSHLEDMRNVLGRYAFEQPGPGGSVVVREPIGVCGLITPWNWPLNQITSKLAPALAAGCTCIIKPSEVAPLSALLLMDVLHNAGVPAGVVNLVNGDGATVGNAIANHPDIDMVSFTGSTRAGVLVAQAAAPSVKRVTQELGGKSANILLPDADLAVAVPAGVARCFVNAGQSCIAPTRMIAPREHRDAVIRHAASAAANVRLGDPWKPDTTMGPLASAAQYERVQRLLSEGLKEGATLVCGGLGRPDGQDAGAFVKPTIFADVTSDMTIARTEIFGPVLAIQFYDTVDEAVAIANDTSYGLAAYVQSRDAVAARRIAARLRAGRIYLNTVAAAPGTPFGGYKQSGNGREQGVFGLEEYLEIKAIISDAAAA